MAIWLWNGVLRLHYPMISHAILQPKQHPCASATARVNVMADILHTHTHTYTCMCAYIYTHTHIYVCAWAECVCVLFHESFCERSAIKTHTATTGTCYSTYILDLNKVIRLTFHTVICTLQHNNSAACLLHLATLTYSLPSN